MKFSEIPYSRPDAEKTKAEIAELTERLKRAESYAEARAIFLEKEEKCKYTNTMDLVAMIRRGMNKNDAFYAEEDKFWWDFEPSIDEYEKAWAEAMLDSPFRRDFAAEYGDMMFLNAEFDRRSMSEKIIDDKQRENELIVEYGELMDSVNEIPFEGGVVDSDEIDKLKEDVDGERRLAAYKAEGACRRELGERLDKVFDELVRLRDGMGRKLGFDGFTDLGYCRRKRTFTKADAERFRAAVVKYVVPVADAIKREQAKRIGRPYPLAYSDNDFFYRSGNAHPAGGDAYLVGEGQKLFDSLSPEAGAFFRHMTENEMMFLHAGGGNDIYLPYYETPFLTVNLDGSGDSVRSFMHEAGHTFAYWMNRKRIPTTYITPSEDITELHSMCMELIALQNAEGFFGADARKFTYILIAESIAFITYGTMVDHFQHIVYARPEMSAAEDPVRRGDPVLRRGDALAAAVAYLRIPVLLHRLRTDRRCRSGGLGDHAAGSEGSVATLYGACQTGRQPSVHRADHKRRSAIALRRGVSEERMRNGKDLAGGIRPDGDRMIGSQTDDD